jgi:PAS domain S-box-containing protein
VLSVAEDVARTVRSAHDVERLLSGVLDKVLGLFACDRAWLLNPCDPDAPAWRVPMERTRPEWPGAFAGGVDIPMTEEAAGIFETALAAPGATTFELPVDGDVAATFGVQTQLVHVIRPRLGEAWLLGIHHCARRHRFGREESELFEVIAGHVETGLTHLLSLRGLHETDQVFRELMESIADVVWSACPSHDTIFYVSRAFERVWGLEERVAYEQPGLWLDTVHPDDRDRAHGALSNVDGPRDVRYRIRRPGGEIRWLHVRLFPVPDGDGAIRRVTGIASDVTEQTLAESERRRMEARAMRAERLASLGALAAGIGHEINNPLTYVLDNLDRAGQRLDAAGVPDVARMVSEARQGAERIQRVAKGLTILLPGEGSLGGRVELSTLLERVVGLTANELRHRARLTVSFGELPWVQADAADLANVFVTLLLYVARSLEASGARTKEVSIVAAVDEGPDASESVVTEICYSSPLVSTEKLALLFDPFHGATHQRLGDGLGLAICHRTVVDLGGGIDVERISADRTSIRVSLPVVDAARPPSDVPRPSAVEAAVSSGARHLAVLIVDDDRACARSLALVLRDHDAVRAHSGREALAVLEDREFDVVLCDVMMPDLSGPAVHAAVAARSPAQAERFVFASGGVFISEVTRALEATGRPCLDKPIRPRELRQLVESVGRRPGVGDPR